MGSSTKKGARGRVIACPVCGKRLPADTSLLNHYCTGKAK